MNLLDFLPYHNRLIKFKYYREWKTGVVIDDIQNNKKKSFTEYVFVSRENLKKWRTADITGDTNKKNKLQEIIDIKYISDPEFINSYA